MTREQHLERGLKRVTEVTHEDEWVNQVAVQFLCEADEFLLQNGGKKLNKKEMELEPTINL